MFGSCADMFLALYIEHQADRHLDLWLGECHLHAGIDAEDVQQELDAHLDAQLLLHPECGSVSTCLWPLTTGDLRADRTHVLGTGGMVRHAATCRAEVDVIGTEVGLLHRLGKETPGHTFLPLREDAVCEYVKAITLPKLYGVLRGEVDDVSVEPEMAARAGAAIDRVLHVKARWPTTRARGHADPRAARSCALPRRRDCARDPTARQPSSSPTAASRDRGLRSASPPTEGRRPDDK